jgi:hypothetical protein
VTSALFGNGASSTWSFNPNALYRLAALQTQGQGGTTIQNFAYTYDPVGNIIQIANTANTNAFAVTNFTYDQLNRLITASTTPVATGTTSIAIMDSLPVTNRQTTSLVTSDAFTYAVPQGGANTLLVALLSFGSPISNLTATQSGASLTCQPFTGSHTRAYSYYCYVPGPTSGTLSVNWTGSAWFEYSVFTVQNAAQANPIDAAAVNDLTTSGSSLSTSITASQNNDLLVDSFVGDATNITVTDGTGQTRLFTGSVPNFDPYSYSSKPSSSAGTTTMTRNFSPNDSGDDLAVLAIKQSTTSPPSITASTTPYRQAFTYDSLGNLLSLTTGWSPETPSLLTSSAERAPGQSTSDSFSFDSGSTGSNRILAFAYVSANGGEPTSATYNGQALTIRTFAVNQYYVSWGYLLNPPMGAHTFSISYPNDNVPVYRVFVFQDVDQSTHSTSMVTATAWVRSPPSRLPPPCPTICSSGSLRPGYLPARSPGARIKPKSGSLRPIAATISSGRRSHSRQRALAACRSRSRLRAGKSY